MRVLKFFALLSLCSLMLISAVSCGESELKVPHTHTLSERHVRPVECYNYGYYETYCEYCSYSVKASDNTLGEHKYKTYLEWDEEPTYNSPGLVSYHCMWFDRCGMFENQHAPDDQQKDPEDFPPSHM